MFVDEISIEAKAGRGGDGVVRWRQEKFVDKGGPWGGNGGRGGDVYMRAVRDLGLLSRYTGAKTFTAKDGEAGATRSKKGEQGSDLYIEVPVGARVIDEKRGFVYEFNAEGETHKILKGGIGGLGNEHFKSSTNRSPDAAVKGKAGEAGTFTIVLSLIVDAGIIGFPNAGKSTLLNALTHARSKIGAYPFTTTEPHLGDFYGYIIADVPGLIEGASYGKGLGHKFLRHIQKTKMLMHCISLEETNTETAYQTIRNELSTFDIELTKKPELIVLTKSDLVPKDTANHILDEFKKKGRDAWMVSAESGEGIKELGDRLTTYFKGV